MADDERKQETPLLGTLGKMASNLRDVVTSGKEQEIVERVKQDERDQDAALVEEAKSKSRQVIDEMKDSYESGKDKLADSASSGKVDKVSEASEDVVDAVQNKTSAASESVKSSLEHGKEQAVGAAKQLAGEAREGANPGRNEQQTIEELVQDSVTSAGEMKQAVKESGKGFVEAIKDIASEATDALSSLSSSHMQSVSSKDVTAERSIAEGRGRGSEPPPTASTDDSARQETERISEQMRKADEP